MPESYLLIGNQRWRRQQWREKVLFETISETGATYLTIDILICDLRWYMRQSFSTIEKTCWLLICHYSPAGWSVYGRRETIIVYHYHYRQNKRTYCGNSRQAFYQHRPVLLPSFFFLPMGWLTSWRNRSWTRLDVTLSSILILIKVL